MNYEGHKGHEEKELARSAKKESPASNQRWTNTSNVLVTFVFFVVQSSSRFSRLGVNYF